MRILSITAQKPSSTGSGVYLTEIVNELHKAGHSQAVIGGVYKDDEIPIGDFCDFYPVYFNTPKLPYPICGMSDEMPYESTRYCDMTPEMVSQFKAAFSKVLKDVVDKFNPDLILTHHLYLLTALVVEMFPDRKIYGFCHNTDLRQMRKNPLEREWIAKNIKKLDHIIVPQTAQEAGVIEIFDYDKSKITRAGMGYNNRIFYDRNIRENDGITRVVFAGKISEKKGLFSLIKSFEHISYPVDKLEFYFAGGAGNQSEADDIMTMAMASKYKCEFLGRMPQDELATVYSRCDIFILPSFCEGIPLTVIEALSCGCRVVMTSLPGIPEWLSETVDDADIIYVDLPELVNTDEPVPETLPAFEKRLGEALLKSIEKASSSPCDVSRVSWTGITELILNI